MRLPFAFFLLSTAFGLPSDFGSGSGEQINIVEEEFNSLADKRCLDSDIQELVTDLKTKIDILVEKVGNFENCGDKKTDGGRGGVFPEARITTTGQTYNSERISILPAFYEFMRFLK